MRRDTFKTYLCDPEKAKKCKKTMCQTYCFETFNKEYRANLKKRIIYWLKIKIIGG